MALLLAQGSQMTHSSHLHHQHSDPYPQAHLSQIRYPMPLSGSNSGDSSVPPTPQPNRSFGIASQAVQPQQYHSAHSSYANTPQLAGAAISSPAMQPPTVASSLSDSATAPSSSSTMAGFRQCQGQHHQSFGGSHQHHHQSHASLDGTSSYTYNPSSSPGKLVHGGNASNIRQGRRCSADGLLSVSASNSTVATGPASAGPYPTRPPLITANSMPSHLSFGTGVAYFSSPDQQQQISQPSQQVSGGLNNYDTSPHSLPPATLPASGLMMGSQYTSPPVSNSHPNAGYSSPPVPEPSSDGVRVPFLGDNLGHYQYQTNLQPHGQFVSPGEGEPGSDYESNDLHREGGWNPFEVKHRRRTTKAQFRILEETFQRTSKPSNEVRKAISEELDMPPRAVQIWFQNRRAKAKAAMRKAAAAAAAAGRHHHHAALLAKQEERDMGGSTSFASQSISPSNGPTSLDRRASATSGNSGASTNTSFSGPSELNWRGQSTLGTASGMVKYPSYPQSSGTFGDVRRPSLSGFESHLYSSAPPHPGHPLQQYGQQTSSTRHSQQWNTSGMVGSVPMSGPSHTFPGYRPQGGSVGASVLSSQDLYSSSASLTATGMGSSHDDARFVHQQQSQQAPPQQHQFQAQVQQQQQPSGSYYTTSASYDAPRPWKYERE